MTHNVFADMWEIAGQAGMNKSIARFPDVCLSPPSPPAGPIPIPYPDTSMSSDLKDGSETVLLGGKPAALAQKSYYKPSALGNEAATRSFGASVITHQITGKTYFQAWSMDVKIEGKNVCRHIDITTSNHGSDPPATPPLPSAEMLATPAQAAIDAGKCPCCLEALHPYQRDDDGNALKPIPEKDYWEKKVQQKEDDYRAKLATLSPKKQGATLAKIAALADTRREVADLMARKDAARADKASGGPGCLNVNDTDGQGCGTFLDTTEVEYDKSAVTIAGKPAKTVSQLSTLDFGSTQYARHVGRDDDPERTPKRKALKAWEDRNAGRPVPANGKMDHKTPKIAGGCNSEFNTVPKGWYSDAADPNDPCQAIEDKQSRLESFLSS